MPLSFSHMCRCGFALLAFVLSFGSRPALLRADLMVSPSQVTGGASSGNAPESQDGSLQMRAEAGDAEAQFSMGLLQEQGVAKDTLQAAIWYGRAAEQGHGIAQHHLGNLFRKGQGVKLDVIEALKWLHLSTGHGFEDKRYAQEKEELKRSMTQEQIKEGERRAAYFVLRHEMMRSVEDLGRKKGRRSVAPNPSTLGVEEPPIERTPVVPPRVNSDVIAASRTPEPAMPPAEPTLRNKIRACIRAERPWSEEQVRSTFSSQDVNEIEDWIHSGSDPKFLPEAISALGLIAVHQFSEEISRFLIEYIENLWAAVPQARFPPFGEAYRALAMASTESGYEFLQKEIGKKLKLPYHGSRQSFALQVLGATRRMSAIERLDVFRKRLGVQADELGRIEVDPTNTFEGLKRLVDNRREPLMNCWRSMEQFLVHTKWYGIIEDTQRPAISAVEIEDLRDKLPRLAERLPLW